MKIINWHLFSNETIEIKNNVVITGENGTGKSTLLDALQYVLTAGKAKFNSAANDSGKRNIEGYMRGKLGREGKPFLRTGDVVSYIVLEYFDETSKRSQLIGVVLELSQANIKKELFFQVLDQNIQDDLFIHKRHIYNRNEFRKELQKRKLKANFADKKSQVPSLFRQSLGVSSKYFELIPRALAFKPINQVYNFIYDFLLNEDPVKIDDLRNNIHAYRHLSDVLKEQQKRMELLEQIEKTYQQYQKTMKHLKNYEFVKDVFYIESLNYQKGQLVQSIAKNKKMIQDMKQQISLIQNQLHGLQKDVFQLESTLESNESYRLKKELEENLHQQQRRFEQISQDYQFYISQLQEDITMLKRLRMKETFVERIQNQDYDSQYLSEQLFDIRNDLNERRNVNMQKIAQYNHEFKQLRETSQQFNKQMELLNRNRFYYRKEVSELIEVLSVNLEEYFQQKVEVKPLCEYLEVTDESWRQAIEGYLNTQRFDLIIEPVYFQKAMQIYEQYKAEHHIFGVGIVNVIPLQKYSQTAENSLAQFVTSYNSYAKNYANMILNKVHCVEHVEDLTQYPIAITKTCMVYQNYAVRAINPKIYQQPYLGQEAMKIQKQIIHQKLTDLKQEMTQIEKQKQDASRIVHWIEQSHISDLVRNFYIIDDYRLLEKQIQDLKTRLSEIEEDDSIMTLMFQLEHLQKELKTVQNQLTEKQNQYSYETVSMENNQKSLESLEQTLSSLPPLPVTLDPEVEKIKQRYQKRYGRYQYQAINHQLQSRINEDNAQVVKDEKDVEYHMRSFNHEAKMGYEENVENIDAYLTMYYQLRDIEIVKRQEDVRQARMKCEMSFQESFISRLYEKIQQAKKDIQELNKGLKNKNFNGDHYEFEVNPSRRPEYRQYYDIISTNQQYNSDNLFVTTLSQENRHVMDELFKQMALLDDNESGEKLLRKYTDYREYLDYDIKITHENGDFTKFSKVNREKSGGETQTPFYVVIASSFEQLIKQRYQEDSGCVVLFDEAFNNMDETRIQSMMKFYNELNVQIIIAVPPDRASTIMPYVDTTLAIIKSGDHSFVEEIIHE